MSRKTSASGINDVYIDGRKVATVDRYSSSAKYQQKVFEVTDLSDGKHTITVRNTGQKNAAASGTGLTLDAFIVGVPEAQPTPDPVGAGVWENDASAIVYEGSNWSTGSSSFDSGGSNATAYGASGAVSLTFTGPAVSWGSRKTSWSGINEV